jgi:hypothetical protein
MHKTKIKFDDVEYSGILEHSEDLGKISYVKNINNIKNFFEEYTKKTKHNNVDKSTSDDTSDVDPMDEYIFLEIQI